MPGNSLGQAFRITTFGESHGPALGVVIDGCPPGIAIREEDFLSAMERRRTGNKAFSSPRLEKDRVEILSGVMDHITTGCPITLLIRNQDARSADYDAFKEIFRPGHADISYHQKYGLRDHRGGGRASSRETVARVAAGVVAQKLLCPLGVVVQACTVELGGIRARERDLAFAMENPLRCPDKGAFTGMEMALLRAMEESDSVGGVVEITGENIPPGLGEPVFDKLEADLGKAILSVGSVKGVEFGAGFGAARLYGSENNDPIGPPPADEGGPIRPLFVTNRAGGILGGISNGDRLIIRAAIKPIPSIGRPQHSIDKKGSPVSLRLRGRFDVCAIPRILPVLEAMVLVVIADHYLRQRAIEGLRA